MTVNAITQTEYIAKAADAMTEDQLLATVREMATALGWRTYHTHDSRRSEAGFPDLVMTRGRRLLVRELKSMRGRLSPAQLGWLADLAVVDGVDVGVWRPADLLAGRIQDELTVS